MDLRNVVRTLSIALLGAAILLPEPASAARCRSGLTTDGRIAVRQRCVSPVSDRPSASVPTPMVEGPVTGGGGAPVVQATSFDLADVGYMVEEFFLAGTAEAYVNVEPLRSNGRWSISPGSTADYKTRIVVYRPLDDAAFSGTVIVEWLNVSGGLDAAPDWTMLHTEITREGHVWVGVSAQVVGIEGAPGGGPIPGLNLSLKGADPERYRSLVHPGDSFSYDMYSQAGQALRSVTEVDPLGGLRPERILSVGESQSAFRLMTYVNAVEPHHRMYDGYLIHSRGGGGAFLSQEPEPVISAPRVLHVRDDLEVPVLMLQTETDLFTLGSLADRQSDSRGFRLWEVAGTAHADTYTLMVGFTDVGDDPSATDVVVTASPIPGIIDCESPINSGPQHIVLKAAFAGLDRWVRTGAAPRRAPRLQVAGNPAAYVLDDYGNARGGIRTSWVDAPVAILSGLGQSGGSFCGIFGTTIPFDAAMLDELYPDHRTYVNKVRGSTNRAAFQGYIRPADAALINQAAEESDIGR
ncbi:MAG: alpha/beta hydrolase domain-containing protein [Candidatus Binatia bacterium]|nr:alpha/beta hydrolase domain-containing protein [Candidatus Binatia bacterium]